MSDLQKGAAAREAIREKIRDAPEGEIARLILLTLGSALLREQEPAQEDEAGDVTDGDAD